MRKVILVIYLLSFQPQLWSLPDLLVADPPTVYVEWLTSAGDTMTSADGDNSQAFDPYLGGAASQMQTPTDKDLYVGVMCNRTTGYDLTLTASNSGATTTTAIMTRPSGSDMTYTAALTKVSGTFAAGATASTQLDLTGATASGSAVFATNGDLPLAAASPNVWKVTNNLPSISGVSDGIIISGSYSGGITATVVLK
jgi:hypothetical protein